MQSAYGKNRHSQPLNKKDCLCNLFGTEVTEANLTSGETRLLIFNFQSLPIAIFLFRPLAMNFVVENIVFSSL